MKQLVPYMNRVFLVCIIRVDCGVGNMELVICQELPFCGLCLALDRNRFVITCFSLARVGSTSLAKLEGPFKAADVDGRCCCSHCQCDEPDNKPCNSSLCSNKDGISQAVLGSTFFIKSVTLKEFTPTFIHYHEVRKISKSIRT
jgi:hypothetical protein